MGKPNILMIYSDQHRFDCVGANGHPVLRTPGLDRLAREGMNFTQSYTPIPMCVPARCSFLTGQWAHQHGTIFNFDAETFKPLGADIPTTVGALRDAGYRTAHIGRWHVDPKRTPLEFGAQEYLPDGRYREWRASRGIRPVPHDAGWQGQVDTVTPPDASSMHWLADELIQWLRRSREYDGPVFVRWQTAEPHLPSQPLAEYAARYPSEAIAPWPSFSDPLDGKPQFQRQMRANWGVEGWGWDRWAPIVARYLAVIAELDHEVGRILEALDDLGMARDTVVCYTTDHGDMGGAHGMVDKHGVLYDDVVRVPMIVRWPGVVAPGSTCDGFVSNVIDLAATFCDIAGAEAPPGAAGLSLVPLLGGGSSWPRTDILSCYHGNQFGGYSQRMVRDRRWKYVWNASDADELYDLAADPGELANLATDRAHVDELARMRARLVAWMQETSDPLLNGWTRRQLVEGRKAAGCGA